MQDSNNAMPLSCYVVIEGCVSSKVHDNPA